MLKKVLDHVSKILAEERGKISSKKREGKNITEIVTEILLSWHKEDRTKNTVRPLLENIVSENVKKNLPVPIAISLAYGGMAINPYKFKDWKINLPRLGDIWLLITMSLIDEEVKKFYFPGVEWYIFDEEEHLILIGHSYDSIEQRRRMLKDMWIITKGYLGINTNIYFERIPNFICDNELNEIDEEIIVAIGCSIKDFADIAEEDALEIMDGFYTSKEKKKGSIELFRSKYKEIWDKAENIAKRIISLNYARKELGYYSYVIGRPYIDASITIKDNRYIPKLITGSTFPQHGESVISDNKVKIIPYYRLANEHWRSIEMELSINGKEIVYSFCFLPSEE